MKWASKSNIPAGRGSSPTTGKGSTPASRRASGLSTRSYAYVSKPKSALRLDFVPCIDLERTSYRPREQSDIFKLTYFCSPTVLPFFVGKRLAVGEKGGQIAGEGSSHTFPTLSLKPLLLDGDGDWT